jgi:hypothetical protein
MSDQLSQLVLDEIKRHDQNHRDLMGEISKIRDEQIEQGKILVRNTVSLEEHIRRTNLLEEKMQDVDDHLDEVRIHITKINFIMGLLKPTKEKIKWLLILSALASGSYGTHELTKGDNFKKVIEYFTSDSN